MNGMDRATGRFIGGMDHLKQSIRDILTMTKGERLICRDYGANLLDYLDQPLTDRLTLEIMSAVANALHAFEPRIILTKVGLVSKNDPNGHLTLRLEGTYADEAFVLEEVTL